MKKFVEDWGGREWKISVPEKLHEIAVRRGTVQCSDEPSPLIIAPPWPPPQVLCRNFPLNGRFGESCSESPLVPLENTTRVLSG